MALATQADLEKFLHIDVTAEPEPAVTKLLEDATGIIQTWLDRRLELASYSETYDSPPDEHLWLKQWPVAASPTVTVTEDGTALTINTDFIVDYERGLIRRTTAAGHARKWKSKINSIVVGYDAGYDFTIDPLVEPEAATARSVCTRIVARAFQAAAAFAAAPDAAAALKSVTLQGSDSVEYADAVSSGVAQHSMQLTEDDMAVLGRLRRMVLVG